MSTTYLVVLSALLLLLTPLSECFSWRTKPQPSYLSSTSTSVRKPLRPLAQSVGVGVDEQKSSLLRLCPSLQLLKTNASLASPTDLQVLDLTAGLESSYLQGGDSILDPVHILALNGAWRTLATTLPLTRYLPLGRLTFAPPDSHLNLVEATLLNIYQHVDVAKGTYDNYVQVSIPALAANAIGDEDLPLPKGGQGGAQDIPEEEITAFVVTRGRIVS
eukprot:CAMPEP_0173300100 /NCGR_PEP_ID=MMETSP1143-20121109/17043_1 /TAXON_ID=483371 /ORGANISM="non described non described, Strain CCMP2298" /LENGTH=217 /DNA_ID=CAMNT_0014240455 /DNA_START=59 /DNA_END=709 /DNA_ORIENTATION=-